jgi:GcrA cell cycle regulator
MSFDWNDATKKTLRALWAEGLTTAEIGRRMGIGKNAVVGKAHRLNLPSRKSPIVRDSGPDINARDQRIMEMVSQGVAQTVAASLAGVTRDVVQGVVSRARQSGRLPDRHLPPATQPPMPGDPLTDAAGRAAEALAEFGRLAAARSAGAASLQVDHQALAELRADIAIWRSSVMHELTDLRRLIERLRDDLASPAAVDAAGCQPQTEAQIEVLRGAEPAGGKAAPAGAVPPRRRVRGAARGRRLAAPDRGAAQRSVGDRDDLGGATALGDAPWPAVSQPAACSLRSPACGAHRQSSVGRGTGRSQSRHRLTCARADQDARTARAARAIGGSRPAQFQPSSRPDRHDGQGLSAPLAVSPVRAAPRPVDR